MSKVNNNSKFLPYEYSDNLKRICFNDKLRIEQEQERLYRTLKDDKFKDLSILQKIDIDKIYELENIAKEIRTQFDHVVIIGIGASILNAKNIILFSGSKNNHPKFHFIDTVDPVVIDEVLNKVNANKTAFLIISKSGNTIESYHITLALIEAYKKYKNFNLGNNFFFILGKQQSKLMDVAVNINAVILEHEDITGRYSLFTSAGLFVGLVANINIKRLCEGANLVIDDLSNNKDNSYVAKSAIFISMMHKIDKKILVNLSYSNELATFMLWYEQLIAESLGKNGKGITPQCKIGPSFQHSLLQLYLDGPQDKSFTLFNINKSSTPKKLSKLDDNSAISLNNILKIAMQSVYHSIINKGLPYREIKVEELSIFSFGSLMMHNILEIVLAGNLLEIDPFNQNAVELLKKEITNKLN